MLLSSGSENAKHQTTLVEEFNSLLKDREEDGAIETAKD